MKRLFVAVPVSEEIVKKIKTVADDLSQTGADLKLVSLSHFHFTLKFLGEVKESHIPEISEKVGKIAQENRKFELTVKGVGVFPDLNKVNVVWIGVEDSVLASVMKALEKELSYVRKNEHEGEIAHLTIARVKSAKSKDKIQELVRKNKETNFGKMPVDKLILYESELTPEGPIYKVVKEFSLG